METNFPIYVCGWATEEERVFRFIDNQGCLPWQDLATRDKGKMADMAREYARELGFEIASDHEVRFDNGYDGYDVH